MGKCQTALSLVLSVIAFIAVGSRDAAAQGAWVGDKGGLDVGLDYNFATSSKVVTDEMDFENGGVDSHTLTVSAEYTPIRSLAVNLQLPVQMLKFTGDVANGVPSEYPHPGHGSYDDGDFHTTLTDLRVGARYQVLDEPVAIAPHVAFSIPVADYETIGNAVAGRHLKMLHVGAGLGYLIGERGYTQLVYEFTLAEKYGDVEALTKHSQNRSDLSYVIGTRLLDYRVDVHADLNLRRTHGGVGLVESFGLGGPEAVEHDAILDEDFFLVGGGVGYQLSNSLAINASARIFVDGDNALNASVFALGLAWSPIQ